MVLAILIAFIAVIPASAQSESWQYQELPEWLERRVVLVQHPTDDWTELVRKSSPNQRYWFACDTPDFSGSPPWNTMLYVFGGGPNVFGITIRNHAGSQVYIQWITPKMLLLRVWWGRMLATEHIIDVEQQTVVYKQLIVERSLALAQLLPVDDSLHPFTVSMWCIGDLEQCRFGKLTVSSSATVVQIEVDSPVSTICTGPVAVTELSQIQSLLQSFNSTFSEDTITSGRISYRIEWEMIDEHGYRKGGAFVEAEGLLVAGLLRIHEGALPLLECDP